MIDEVWVPVKGFEGLYEVSSWGRVRSLQYGNPRLLADGILSLSNGSSKRFRITNYRLAAIHFVPNPLNLPIVGHRDKDETNHKVSNLFWTTVQTKNWDPANHVAIMEGVLAKGGLYGICNLNTDQWYIGASIDLYRRSKNYNRPKDRVSQRLQAAFDKHGRGAFIFVPLFYLTDGDRFDLLAAEETLIEQYDSVINGYNLRQAEIGDPGDAYKAMLKTTMHTKEAFAKHIVTMKKTLALPETKARYSNLMKTVWQKRNQQSK